jgi:hypothetical protein
VPTIAPQLGACFARNDARHRSTGASEQMLFMIDVERATDQHG